MYGIKHWKASGVGGHICFSFVREVIMNLKLYLSKGEARVAYIFFVETAFRMKSFKKRNYFLMKSLEEANTNKNL